MSREASPGLCLAVTSDGRGALFGAPFFMGVADARAAPADGLSG